MSKKMKRRDFIKTTSTGTMALAMSAVIHCREKPDRPNILWLTSEDNGPFLGCYGDPNANTPNMDRLASEGIMFTHAFANAPVCAPARNSIITGMYASSLGTQHMRSKRAVPNSITFFPQLLRQAGYYCTNNSKEDYNVAKKPDNVWDESSTQATYANRNPEQPFFAVFNFTVSHESSLHQTTDVQHDPDQMRLPDYHPDDPVIRHDWAQYYDRIAELDCQIGDRLNALEAEGLLDNTIVFYYSDHGGVLTRSKRFLYDSGIHVPFIVRFPKQYQHLAPSAPGTMSNRLISFVDLAPTILSLAGVEIPSHMQGQAFLGLQQRKPQDYVYCFRDRMDERYDLMRAVHSDKFKYIRNYMPHLIYGQHVEYLWRMPTTRRWESLYKQSKCAGSQRFFWEHKPAEELYDTENDPDEVKNLAEDPDYRKILFQMRQALNQWMEKIQDTGFIPEGEMIARTRKTTVYEMVRKTGHYDFEKSSHAAETASLGKIENLFLLKQYMHDADAVIRYWGITGCLILGCRAVPLLPDIQNLFEDACPDVQIAAAEYAARFSDPRKSLSILSMLLDHEINAVRLRAANAIDYLNETARPLKPKMLKKISDPDEDVRKVILKALSDLEK
ncbi:sulfatase-like hydrolase/transferase [bacterium]|nr:sulfatase-like hydrolase/transferase [bacterium]